MSRFEDALAANRRQVRLAHRHGMNYLLLYGLWNQCLAAQDRAYVNWVKRIAIQQSSIAAWRSHASHRAAMSFAEALRIGSG